MMATSLKEAESYIYSSVILPLKDLTVEQLQFSSHIKSLNGSDVIFEVGRESVRGDFEHNFQRDNARRFAKWLVYATDGRNRTVVADYEPKRHKVQVYTLALRNLGVGPIIVNRFVEAFLQNTPFDKVVRVEDTRDETVTVSLADLPF